MLMMMKENNITPFHLICILRLRTVRRMSGASPAVVRGWTDWKMMRNLKKWFIMSICVFCKFLIIVAKRCARAETRRQWEAQRDKGLKWSFVNNLFLNVDRLEEYISIYRYIYILVICVNYNFTDISLLQDGQTGKPMKNLENIDF